MGCGEMAEWLIAPVLKTGIVLGTIEGSNPSLSFLLVEYIFLLVLPGQGHNERVVARLSRLAKPEKKIRYK